jgi:hypothetical protein
MLARKISGGQRWLWFLLLLPLTIVGAVMIVLFVNLALDGGLAFLSAG